MSVRREPDALEDARTPSTWKRWTRFRTRDGVEECHAFERPKRVHEVETLVDDGLEYVSPRRGRGSQAEPGHHLGRGTKWTKPGSTK